MKTNQTLAERIEDDSKVPLSPEFVRFIVAVAALNGETADKIWDLWDAYSEQCRGYDQSPVIFEFCEWFGLNEPGRMK